MALRIFTIDHSKKLSTSISNFENSQSQSVDDQIAQLQTKYEEQIDQLMSELHNKNHQIRVLRRRNQQLQREKLQLNKKLIQIDQCHDPVTKPCGGLRSEETQLKKRQKSKTKLIQKLLQG